MGKPALESEFNSAGCMITALKFINQRWKTNLTALNCVSLYPHVMKLLLTINHASNSFKTNFLQNKREHSAMISS